MANNEGYMEILTRRGKKFMEQKEVNKMLCDISDKVKAAIGKPTENHKSLILPSQNGSITGRSKAQCVETGCGGIKLNDAVTYLYAFTLCRIVANFIPRYRMLIDNVVCILIGESGRFLRKVL